MSRFAEDAQRLFETAETASNQGLPCSGVTVLIGEDRSLRIVAESDWPLDSLMLEHGARTGYRVSEQAGIVRVEGREGARKCTFESSSPDRAARLLLRTPCWNRNLLTSGSL